MHLDTAQCRLRRWISICTFLIIAVTFANACGELRSARTVDGDVDGNADTGDIALTLLIGGDDIGFGDPFEFIAAYYNEDNFLDLAIPNENDNTLTVLFNDGDGAFTEAAAAFDTGGLRPTAVDPEDLDNDKCTDIVGVNEVRLGGAAPGGEDVGSVFVLFNNNGVFEPAMTFDVGLRPTDVAAADFDGDGYSDVAVVNTDSATVSVLLNLGNGALGPPIDLPVGLQPRPIDANERRRGRIVQVLRNVTILPGRLAFDPPVSFGVNADPKVVVSNDMNLDALEDLITVNGDPDGESGGSVSVSLNDPMEFDLCPWDLDDNGVVGPEDLIALLGAWGVVGHRADFQDPSGVGPEDLIVLLGNWGACP